MTIVYAWPKLKDDKALSQDKTHITKIRSIIKFINIDKFCLISICERKHITVSDYFE